LLDYYRILEVDPKASKEVIEKAFKALSLKHHPDKNPDEAKKTSTERWMKVREAYEVLSDPKKRAEYDAYRKKEALDVFLNEGLLGLARRYLR